MTVQNKQNLTEAGSTWAAKSTRSKTPKEFVQVASVDLCLNRTLKLAFIGVTFLCLLSSNFVQAQIQDRPKAGADQKKLEIHVGEWKYEGTLKDTPLGPGGKFAGKSTSRMILDGLFLESRNEDKGFYGGKEMVYKGVSIQWFDSATKGYTSQSFDNDGIVTRSATVVNGNSWASTGNGIDSKGKAYRYRDTTTFSADGKTSSTKSELSVDDGKTWMPYWESTATKVGK